MVLARSIRRKLIVGLALVLVMMATLSISGLGGLWSSRQAVRELNFSVFEAPDRERLEAKIAGWRPRCSMTAWPSRAGSRERHREAVEALSVYRMRWGRLTPSRRRGPTGRCRSSCWDSFSATGGDGPDTVGKGGRLEAAERRDFGFRWQGA
ncbi:MAG: hypothetical protein Ct9H300mP1_21760 [Planctomycetaceae bacterium]|nr:MAG: hypothetical protein Ct9H300mP1_21760 [Planctomycetaceae bacterium]